MAIKSYVMENVKIKQNSIFNMAELYKIMFRWFENYDYAFYERLFEVANLQGGQTIKFYWVAEKKVDSYTMYVIELNAFITGFGDVEIEKHGLKTKTNKGTLEFRVSVYLKKDYDDKWKNVLPLRYIYDKVLIRGRLDRYGTELSGESKKLIDEIKAFLNLHQL